MTSQQLARLEQLDGMEFQTAAEEAEHAYLLRLSSEMQQAFNVLQEQGLHPTWVGGEYIVANPANAKQAIVRDLRSALRLVSA